VANDAITDAIVNLGNKIFGTWSFKFYMYVPTGRSGYFNLQGLVPQEGGEWIVGNIELNEDLANPGIGTIDMLTATTDDDYIFDFPHDEWFEVIINVDISTGITLSTWQFYVDGVEVVPSGTAFEDGNGVKPTSFGGVNFWSCSTECEYWLDDFTFSDSFQEPLGVDDLVSKGFLI
jgi:hypothetical protein